MIEIKQISVKDCFSTNFLYISFEIKPTSEDLANYALNLYKSGNADSEYTLIYSDLKEFAYTDDEVNLHDNAHNYYYKVGVRNLVTNQEVMSDVIGEYKYKTPDTTAETIAFMYEQYLNNVVDNEDLYLLSKRHSGQKCSCFDDIRKRSKPEGCELCYGVSYVGGYYPQKTVKVNFTNTPVLSEEFTPSAEDEVQAPIQFWTLGFPLIHTGDILVDRNNMRYIVTGADRTTKNYYILRQTIQMQRLPKSNIVYKFPIDI